MRTAAIHNGMLRSEDRAIGMRSTIVDSLHRFRNASTPVDRRSLETLQRIARRFNENESKHFGLPAIAIPPMPTRSIDRRFYNWPMAKRRSVAVHELGHAVAFEALGTRVESVEFTAEDKRSLGVCRLTSDRSTRSEDRLTALVAGPVAEARETGASVERLLQQSDHADIREELARMGQAAPLSVTSSPAVRSAIQRAETILDRHRAALAILTDTLARYGQCEGDIIRRTMASLAQKRKQATSARGGHALIIVE